MLRASSAVLAGLSLVALLSVVGCGSGEPGNGPALEPRIQEYVGDGGGSLKPWPGLLGPAPTDQPQVTATKIVHGAAPLTGTVARRQTNWYRLDHVTAAYAGKYVVTLQPTADEDADLYLLEASAYHDGAACLGSSRRTPTSAGTLGGGGYAPDWVPLVVADTNYFPAAIVAVYGVNSSPGTKHFRVESFRTVALTVGAGAIYDEVVQYASDWWTFVAVNGQDYTVRMTQTSGDSDLFVYENTSSEFVSKNTGTGDADIFFTAAETGEHFIRVYGWSGGTSGYEIRVTSP